MGHLTHTVGGDSNLVSFRTPARVPVESLKCHFTPIQNGSGDPSPYNVRPIIGWTGVEASHAGKNLVDEKFLANANNYPNAGSYGYYYTNDIHLPPNTLCRFVWYDYDNTTMDELSSNIHLYVTGASEYIINNSDYRQYSSGFLTPSTGVIRFGINHPSQLQRQGVLDAIFNNGKLLLQIGTEDIPYEQYQGETIPVTFPTLGKNLLNTSTNVSEGKLMDTVGELTDDLNYNTTDYISLPANQTYTFSCKNNSLEEEQTRIRLIVFEPDTKVFKSRIINKKKNPNEDYSYTFSLYTNSLVRLSYHTTDYNIQLEYGSEATAYEPYNPNNTVYGGYVDLAAGEVVAEWKIIDAKDYSWTWFSANDSIYHNFSDEVYKEVTEETPTGRKPLYCNVAKYTSNSFIYHGEIAYGGVENNGYILLRNNNYSSAQDWIDYFASNTVQIVYPLATPIHYPLTPTQIQTLLDRNNFYSNTNGNTEVSYAVHDTAPIRAAKKRIAANEPHIITPATAGLVSFSTDMIAPLKECKVHFSPVQSGTGDPSPTNARPISGWTGCDVYGTGKNLVDWTQYPFTDKKAFSPQSVVNTRGSIIDNDYHCATLDFIPCSHLHGKTITFTPRETITTYASICFYELDNEDTFVAATNQTIVVPSNANYMRFVTERANLNAPKQLELGSTATSYTPYTGTTIPISWQSEAGTIYGGYMDLVRGEVVAEWGSVTIDDNYEVYGGPNTKYNGEIGTNRYFIVPASPVLSPFYISRGNVYCDKLKVTSNSTWSTPDDYVWNTTINSKNQCHIVFDNATVGINSSDTYQSRDVAISAWLAENPITVVYLLETPIRHTIDPATLRTLRGMNNVWSNTNGTIDLSYWSH